MAILNSRLGETPLGSSRRSVSLLTGKTGTLVLIGKVCHQLCPTREKEGFRRFEQGLKPFARLNQEVCVEGVVGPQLATMLADAAPCGRTRVKKPGGQPVRRIGIITARRLGRGRSSRWHGFSSRLQRRSTTRSHSRCNCYRLPPGVQIGVMFCVFRFFCRLRGRRLFDRFLPSAYSQFVDRRPARWAGREIVPERCDGFRIEPSWFLKVLSRTAQRRSTLLGGALFASDPSQQAAAGTAELEQRI